MLVSHDHKFIFLKTRKTAGTSIEMLFEPYCAPPGHVVVEKTDGRVTDHGIIGFRLKTEPSETAVEYRSHLPAYKIKRALKPKQWKTYFRFTAVRNPFSRCVSGYYFGKHVKGLPIPTDFSELKEDFLAYLQRSEFRNDQSVTHFQGEYIAHDAVRYESMAEDVERIGQKIGIKVSADNLPVTKKLDTSVNRPAYGDYYLTKSRDVVLEKMEWVFKNFDYSTDPRDA